MNDQLQTTQIAGVPRTMLLTLKGRADEQTRRDRLFEDPLAIEWSKTLPWDDELEKVYSPFKQTSWGVRACLYDQIVSGYIANHKNLVVVELGAGMSTRYHRIGRDAGRWFVLDLPLVIDLRCQLDTQTDRYQSISKSVMDFSWMATIRDIRPDNILFMAEGLLMYFEEKEVRGLISQMRSQFPGAVLVMDALGELGKLGEKEFAQLGAEFKWYAANEREVEKMGLSLLKVWPLYQSYPEHWPWFVKWISWLPSFRNGYLTVEARLKPLVN